MRLLELFCGTKSIGKVFERNGWDVVSVDILKEFNPTYCQSLLDLDLRLDLAGKFDVIWASPPCTTFSIAAVSHHWKNGVPSDERVVGNALLSKTLEIINLKQPKYWFIENPRGMMRKLPIMQYLPKQTVSYCQYGDTRMKPTDIWTNCDDWLPKSICKNGDSCHESAPRGAKTGTQGLKGSRDRSVIPEGLVVEIYHAVTFQLRQKYEAK
jgi:hypothetical protein